ncbi:hypothetical protein EMCRGX_G029950 [Ephydatia muelleri]|eukprot:Em0010g180a
MDTLFGRRITFSALSNFSNLNKATQRHLKNVYASLALATLSAALGAFVFFFTQFRATLLASLGSIVILLVLYATPHSVENLKKRLGLLCGFGFCSGISMGPLLHAVVEINPSIIPTAFLSTCIIFACLSLASLYAERRSYLYLGGVLMSTLSLLIMMSFFNLFLRSYFTFQIELYLGLVVFCGFVLFDTQLIVERFNLGDTDYIKHSLDLFLDFIEIFRRILIIMSSKEKKERKRN